MDPSRARLRKKDAAGEPSGGTGCAAPVPGRRGARGQLETRGKRPRGRRAAPASTVLSATGTGAARTGETRGSPRRRPAAPTVRREGRWFQAHAQPVVCASRVSLKRRPRPPRRGVLTAGCSPAGPPAPRAFPCQRASRPRPLTRGFGSLNVASTTHLTAFRPDVRFSDPARRRAGFRGLLGPSVRLCGLLSARQSILGFEPGARGPVTREEPAGPAPASPGRGALCPWPLRGRRRALRPRRVVSSFGASGACRFDLRAASGWGLRAPAGAHPAHPVQPAPSAGSRHVRHRASFAEARLSGAPALRSSSRKSQKFMKRNKSSPTRGDTCAASAGETRM